MSWLDKIPVCNDVYVFQASLICSDCSRLLIKRLQKEHVADDGDSNSYPQGPYSDGGGESDSFHFCDNGRSCINAFQVVRGQNKIGCPLGNSLTSDGAKYLNSTIHTNLLSHREFERRVGRLLRHVWTDYVQNSLSEGRLPAQMPDSLRRSIVKYRTNRPMGVPDTDPDVGSPMVCDADHVYTVGRFSQYSRDLLRIEVDADGDFSEVEVARVPLQVATSSDPVAMLTDAVSEMAWD